MAPTSEVTDVYPPPFYDPLTAIAWLAGQAQDLLFATSVLVVPYRHPLLTARVSAMLHEISGGRFALGVGVGWSATEFQALGADYARRGQITDDYLQVITTAWRQRHIDADLGGLRITGVATGPTRRRPHSAVGRRLGPGHPACVRFGTAWHPITPTAPGCSTPGCPPCAGRASASAPYCQASCTDQVPACGRTGRPALSRLLGVGTITQITRTSVPRRTRSRPHILDPNPDTPRPRDYAGERNDLLAVRAALI